MKKLRFSPSVAMRPSKRKLLALTVSVFMFVGVSLWWTTDRNASAQQGGRDELRIELSSSGFTPHEVQHAPGRFAIAVVQQL